MQVRSDLVHRRLAARAARLRAAYEITRHNPIGKITGRILNDGCMLRRIDAPALTRRLQHWRDRKAIVEESIAASDDRLGRLVPLADTVSEAQAGGPVIFVVDVTLRLPTHAVTDSQILPSLPVVLVVQTHVEKIDSRAGLAIGQIQLAGSTAEGLNLLECLARALAVNRDAISCRGICVDAGRAPAGALVSAEGEDAVEAGVGRVGVTIHTEASAKIDGVCLPRDLRKVL